MNLLRFLIFAILGIALGDAALEAGVYLNSGRHQAELSAAVDNVALSIASGATTPTPDEVRQLVSGAMFDNTWPQDLAAAATRESNAVRVDATTSFSCVSLASVLLHGSRCPLQASATVNGA